MTAATLDAALAPVATMLEADGYGLAVDLVPSGIHLTVSAGPDACKECLVPKPIFAGVVRTTLTKAGISLGEGAIEVSYPEVDGHEA